VSKIFAYICIIKKQNQEAMNERNQQGIDVELDQEVAMGHYSNMAIISHSSSEFIIDFVSVLPGLPKPKVCSRVILTPEHAKRLLLSLQENIARYESNVARIELQQTQGPHGFKRHGEA
jgi:hypothetical protein